MKKKIWEMPDRILTHTPVTTAKAKILRRNMTPAEEKMWSLVRANALGVHFRRQVPFGPYILDFLCLQAKLVVELDGSQHFTKEAMKYDKHRDQYLQLHGFTVFRFTNKEFLTNTDKVLNDISEFVLKNVKK